MHREITIRLEGQATADGRMYVTSPDFWGFHYVLEPDEDSMQDMLSLLTEFITRKLKIRITNLRPAVTPKGVLERKRTTPMAPPMLPDAYIAAVA